MSYLGVPVSVTSADVRRLMRALADDRGFVVSCSCGASRYWITEDEAMAFRILHRACKPGAPCSASL